MVQFRFQIFGKNSSFKKLIDLQLVKHSTSTLDRLTIYDSVQVKIRQVRSLN